MKTIRKRWGWRGLLVLLLAWNVAVGEGLGQPRMDRLAVLQEISPAAAQGQSRAEKPLPDLVTMMHAVQRNERAAEATEKNYIYHSVETMSQNDKHGGVKKSEVRESDSVLAGGGSGAEDHSEKREGSGCE